MIFISSEKAYAISY